MALYRKERLQEIILRELSKLIREEADFGPEVFISVVAVEVSDDFNHAHIRVSIFPEKHRKTVLQFLRKNVSNFQWQITKNIRIKRAPELLFYIDEGMANAAKIDKIIKEELEKNI